MLIATIPNQDVIFFLHSVSQSHVKGTSKKTIRKISEREAKERRKDKREGKNTLIIIMTPHQINRINL
jgi:hypothetical protein